LSKKPPRLALSFSERSPPQSQGEKARGTRIKIDRHHQELDTINFFLNGVERNQKQKPGPEAQIRRPLKLHSGSGVSKEITVDSTRETKRTV